MKVAIYARVSTDEQAERQTIGAQLAACSKWAEARGYVVGELFADDGVSGALPLDERPEGARLLAALDAREYDRVVIYAVDRLSRGDMGQAARDYNTLFKATNSVESDERVHFTNMDIATSTPEGELMLGQLQLIARYERRVIARRTKEGRYRKVSAGKYMAAKPPYGYRRDPETANLEVNPEQAEVISRMFAWAKAGAGLQVIANRLETEEIPFPVLEIKRCAACKDKMKRRREQDRAGLRAVHLIVVPTVQDCLGCAQRNRKKRMWPPATIWKLLNNPRYTGQGSYGGRPMTYPRIVDDETFAAVKLALAERKGRGIGPQRWQYLLQHRGFCRACGGRAAGRTDSRPNGWSLSVYQCGQARDYRKARMDHGRWRWRTDDVEATVQEWLFRLLTDPDALTRAQVFTEQAAQEKRDRERAAARARGELDGLEAEEQSVITFGRKGWITDESMLQQLDQIKARRAELEELLQRFQAEAPRPQPVDPEELMRLSESFRQTMDLCPWDFPEESAADALTRRWRWATQVHVTWRGIRLTWRDLVEKFVSRVWLEPDGTVTVEGLLPSPPLAGGTNTSVNSMTVRA